MLCASRENFFFPFFFFLIVELCYSDVYLLGGHDRSCSIFQDTFRASNQCSTNTFMACGCMWGRGRGWGAHVYRALDQIPSRQQVKSYPYPIRGWGWGLLLLLVFHAILSCPCCRFGYYLIYCIPFLAVIARALASSKQINEITIRQWNCCCSSSSFYDDLIIIYEMAERGDFAHLLE